MDITDQILRHHQIYGSSDFTAQHATSSSRALNYANGASIQKPELERVTTIPRVINYQDTVGLFGSENHFIRVDLKLQNPVSACFEEPGWECSRLGEETVDPEDEYTFNSGNGPIGQAYIDRDADIPQIVNSYERAKFEANTAYQIDEAMVKIDLNNLKTGNIYIDSWLDIRLYNKAREEHPHDVMYVGTSDYFYIGVHARNTRRLPYNIECAIGKSTSGTDDGYVQKTNVPEHLLAIN